MEKFEFLGNLLNDSAYMDIDSFRHWGRTVWKYRADSSGENQPLSILLLDDLTSHKNKEVLYLC